MGCLYQLTSPSGKSYVGITAKTLEQRWSKHIEHALGKRDNGALYAALRKYGPDTFTVKELVRCGDWSTLQRLEIMAIAVLGTRSPRGYNISTGGEGVQGTRDDKAKAAISKAQKARFLDVEQRARLAEYGRRGREALRKKYEAQRIEGLPPWKWRRKHKLGAYAKA